MQPEDTKNISNAEAENQLFDGIFDKEDRTGIIAGFIDITILTIGIIVAFIWQMGLVSHPAPAVTTSWQPSTSSAPSSNSNSTSVATSTSGSSSNVAHIHVCQAFVQTKFKNGQTHYVEFRGNCAAINNMAAHSKTPVRVMPQRNYTVALNHG